MSPERLPRTLVNQILRQAQQYPGTEVCGLIGGRNGLPARCYPVANIATDPAHLFAMDPAGQIAAMRAMRDRGETLYAIYHSHPESPPRPSATDLREANYPGVLYLIVSLQIKGVLEMRGFRIRDERVEEIPLEINDDPAPPRAP